MSRGRAVNISLSDQERAKLIALTEHSNSLLNGSNAKAKRPQIILYAAAGWANARIARHLDISPKVVSRWRNRYAREGISCLKPSNPTITIANDGGTVAALDETLVTAPVEAQDDIDIQADKIEAEELTVEKIPKEEISTNKDQPRDKNPKQRQANGVSGWGTMSVGDLANLAPLDEGAEWSRSPPTTPTSGAVNKTEEQLPSANGNEKGNGNDAHAISRPVNGIPHDQSSAPVNEPAHGKTVQAAEDSADNTSGGPALTSAIEPQATKSQVTKSKKIDEQAIKSPEIKAPEIKARNGSGITANKNASRDVNGASSDNGGSANGGGSNGGGTNGSDLHQRSDDPDFRNALVNVLAALRRHAMIVGIFSVAVNLLILAIPIYLFQVSDRVLTSRSEDTLVMLTIIVLGALLVHVLMDMMRRFLLMRAAVEMETTLGGPVLSAAVKSCQSSSNVEFQALKDLNVVRNFLTGPVMLTFFDAPIAPIFFLAVFLIHPHLGYIITGSALIVLVIALFNQKMTAVPFARAGGFAMRATLQADSMARNALVMNAMGMIREGVQLWGRDTAEQLKSQIIAQDRNILMTGISKFIRLGTQVTMLGWGAHLALMGELTGGMIIAASIIGSRALAPVVGTIEGWGSFVHARSGYGRIKALLHSSPLNQQRLRLPRPTGSLTVERVLFVPPPNKKIILNGISFTLDAGDSLAIMGSSGTGKTTLARMLVGSIAPTAGSVRMDKMDIRHWDPRQFGECIGYLPQDVELFPASIKDNISRMRHDVSDENIFDAAEIAGVHEMISQLPQGYETQIAVDGSPLSGGQKQRIGLARAFFGTPKLVVLDEPNSNLDTPGEVALGAALKRAKARNITVVTVTQRPSLLKSVDKIMLLKEGRVQLMGQRDDVIKQLSDGRAAA